MKASRKIFVSLPAIVFGILVSFSALASYVYVNGQGAGPSYAAARGQAINTASLYCAAQGGTPTGIWTDTFVNEDSLGNWIVAVTGACFIAD